MKYKILRGILIAGVVLGFGSGFAHLGARWAMHCKDGRGHCQRSCPDGSRWGRDADREQRATRPPAASPAASSATPATAAGPAAAAPTPAL